MSKRTKEDKELEEIKRIFRERFGETNPGEKRGIFGMEAEAQQ